MAHTSQSSDISIRWQQVRLIGEGAFGPTYLSINLDSGLLVTVREIRFQFDGLPHTPFIISHTEDKLNALRMLHHPNVGEFYGVEVHQDKVYIFEEYCQGGSIGQLLEHGRIEDEGIIQVYAFQMLEGLCYLHAEGIVHRDVKPDNILIDHMGVIKFVDFEAAEDLANSQRTMQRTRSTLDSSSSVISDDLEDTIA